MLNMVIISGASHNNGLLHHFTSGATLQRAPLWPIAGNYPTHTYTFSKPQGLFTTTNKYMFHS